MNAQHIQIDEMDKIEYRQIREDVRHINNMFYYIFSVMALVFGLLLNVSYQSIRAAMANPVISLRSE